MTSSMASRNLSALTGPPSNGLMTYGLNRQSDTGKTRTRVLAGEQFF